MEEVFPIGSDPHEGVFRSVSEAEVSLDEMLSLACRQGKQDIVELLLESGANVNHRNKAGNTPLLEACSQGHVSIARLLLDRSADIDSPTETTYDSALTWACTLGNVEIVRLLLDRKADVEHRTKDGCTALMFAALAGHEKVARLLLDHRAEINVESDSNKDSPLTFACWKGHQKVVELFLERNADIEHRTKEGFSPLMFAALGGHTQVAELLLKHRAKVNNPSGSNNDIPLTSACWKGHHQVVYLLLQHNSDIEHRTKDGCTPLMLAAREGHLSVAQLLLDHGAKVNMPSGSENNIPLTLACWKGHRDVVNLLLKNVSNIEHQNKAGCTPLMLAAREGHQEATRLLLDSGAQINVPSGSNDDTPLTLACWKGHEEVVSLLIARNSNVNHQTKTGCTPLMEATREGHVGVAKLLLEAGADVETPDNYGQSPFFMACWKGHADVAALLLEYEANKDCRTKTGITPLFQACRENHVDVVKLLLDYGCNPSNPFPNSRECPLTLAAEKGYVELTQLLLSRSAYVEARTKKGCSPLYLACREGFKEIAVMLAKHGASTESPDLRGTTPLLAAYKNGHFEVVEWLLAHVAHLPSDPECNKALLAPMPTDTDLAPQRSKCIELIMKAKKAREQAALKNAQILCEELEAEREKKESRRKAAAKKRDKRKKKKKEQAEKMDAPEGDKEEESCYPVEGRDGPNREEESATQPQPPSSPASITPSEVSALDALPADNHLPKKRISRAKRSEKFGQELDGSPESTAPLPMDDGSDSGDEYHDALPEFCPTEVPDYHEEQLYPLSPLSPPSRPSITSSNPQYLSSSSHDTKLPLSSQTDMSATRYGGQTSKRTPQPKAEVSPSSSTSKPSVTGNSRGSEGSSERNRNDQVRGNQGAGYESKRSSNLKAVRKTTDKDGSSNSWNNQKNRSRDVRWARMPFPAVSNASMSTREITSTTFSSHKTEVNSGDPKASSQTHSSTRGRAPSKQSSTRGCRSNSTTSSESGRQHGQDHSPPCSVTDSTNEDSYLSSSTKAPVETNWSKKIIYSNSSGKDLQCNLSPTPATLPDDSSEHKPHLYGDKEVYLWTSSQELEDTGDWGDEMDLEDPQLIWSRSTDDAKIQSQKLKAAAAAQREQQHHQSGPVRPMATSAYPTPNVNTGTSSTTSAPTSAHPPPTANMATVSNPVTYISTQNWQEVTRPTRTVQLTVSNSLVGRIIGLGGSKITSIQAISGAHINVSKNIPKSTERLITIKGTQRSISKAQELIDEALSMPDNTAEIACAPFPDRGSSKMPNPTSPSLLTTRSDSPSSGGVAPSRQVKRYSDVIPSKETNTISETTKPSISRRPVPISKDPVRPTSTTGLTTTSGCASSSRLNSWTSNSSTFASVAAATATPSPTFPTPQSNSPVQENVSICSDSAPPPPASSSVDSEEERLISPVQTMDSSSVEKTLVDNEEVNSDFPPLSTTHSCSRSDPQVSSLGEREGGGSDSTDKIASTNQRTQSPTLKTMPDSISKVSNPIPIIHSIQNSTSQSEDVSTMLRSSERLPFVSSLKSQTGVDKGDRDELEAQGTLPASIHAAKEGVTSSLAVGTRPPKVTKSVAIIQPTQQQTSMPPNFLPLASQSNSTPDLTNIPAPSSRGGNYGAIGPPTRRRKSLPSSAVKGPPKKLSYAGFLTTLENVVENDPLNTLPAGYVPPLSSTHSASAWPNDNRRRSTGQQPFIYQNSHSFKAPPHTSSQIHSQSDDPLVPLGTPDTPHGENIPMTDQDFTAPGGVYGAIGSSMPNNSGASGHATSHSLSSSMEFSNSPLSSPHLSHPPAPPPNMKIQVSDIWFHSGPTGPRMHPVAQVTPSGHGFGVPPFPPRQPSHQHHVPFPPHTVPPKSNSDSSHHMFQWAAMGHQQKHSRGSQLGGDSMVGIRHGFGDDSTMHHQMGEGTGTPVYQKRWSVPSFSHMPQPAVPLYPPNYSQLESQQQQQQQQQSWEGWTKQGGQSNTPVGCSLNGQYTGFEHDKPYTHHLGGNMLSRGDPWSPHSHWTPPSAPGGQEFPTSSSSLSRYNEPATSSVTTTQQKMVKVGRSVSCVTEPSWRDLGLEVGVTRSDHGETDLVQLMKSLDINSEHMQSLEALSLQQLHSMSDDEWRCLKLPVGPRVKLMNAISNIHRKGNVQGAEVSEALSFSPKDSILTS